MFPDLPKQSSQKFIIYDCEIIRCIPDLKNSRNPKLKYCQGWEDFKGMGISVICAYASWEDSYHIYLDDNLLSFQELVNQADEIVGFNSLSFDDPLCIAHGIKVKTTYDLLCQVRIAAGMPPHYVKGVTLKGYSLEALAQANFGYGKAKMNELAPELWQQGQRGQVIDYCLKDVTLTRKLYEQRFHLLDPTNGKTLNLK